MSATGTGHLQPWDDLFGDALGGPGEVPRLAGHDDQVPGAGVEERLQAGAHVVAGAGDGHVIDDRREARPVTLLARADEGRRPAARLIPVVVDADVDENHPLERREVPAAVGGHGPDGPHRFRVPGRRVQKRHPAVAEQSGPAHGGPLPAGHDDGRPARLDRRGRDAHGVEWPEFPGIIDLGAGPEGSHDSDRLVRARPPVGRIDLAAAELGGVLAAHSHAERHPAPGEHVEFGGLLGDDHRMVERCEQDGGPHGGPLGDRGQRGEPGHRLGHVPADSEMAGRPQRIDPQRLEKRNGRPQLRQRPDRADEAHPRPTSHDHIRHVDETVK
jgi:hypothetical protein